MPTRRKATDLELDTIVAYLVRYDRGDLHINGQPPLTKNGRKGQLFNLRTLLRREYPRKHVTILMIRDALKLRPEWEQWEQTMVDEKKEYSVEKRIRKAKTKVARSSLPQPPYDVRGEEDPSHEDIIAFLEQFRAGDFNINGQPPASTILNGTKPKGRTCVLRGILRTKYPCSKIRYNAIKRALNSKPEWSMWAREVEELRKSDLRQRKIRRAQLKAVAEAKRNLS